MTTPNEYQTFSSLGEYLEFCQNSKRTYIQKSKPTESWTRIHGRQIKKLGIKNLDPTLFYNNYLNQLFVQILESSGDYNLKKEATDHVAVGFLESNKLEPEIHRSDDGTYYAILIPSAFLSLLNHYLKIVASANHPHDVIYCNGKNVRKLNKNYYVNLSSEMLSYYRGYSEIKGPDLKLKIGSRASKLVDNYHTCILAFIIGHELAHYINDDLADSSNPKNFKVSSVESLTVTSTYHTNEFKADAIGAQLLMRLLHIQSPTTTVTSAFRRSIILLFNLVREIQENSTEFHPMSRTRICAIIDHYLGRSAANMMSASFNNLNFLHLYEKTYGDVMISDVLTDLFRASDNHPKLKVISIS